jgi:LysM repeat protein
MKNGGWLDSYDDEMQLGGYVYPVNYVPQAENGIEGTMGGLTDKGFNYNGAWGGTMQMGGSMPGSVGFTYARTKGIPSNGPYAKKTMASAQNGMEMKFYQEGLDWTPKNISKQGSKIKKDDNGYWNPDNWGEPVEINSNEITMQGVYEPLLGISDTGDTQMMYPGEDYTFDGESVTEYPIKKNGGWLEKYAEGGDITGDESYNIQKGDTLSNISSRFNVPLATLANANQLQNPNLIQAGKKLNIPTQAKKELTFEEIPTADNKKVVIDNFSKHYDYIVEGDNVYYKTKGGKTWADISDNKGAQSNLLKFLDKNNYWAGYNSGEKELLQTGQVPKKQQVQIDLPKLTPINTRATADATQVAKSLTKSVKKEDFDVLDALSIYAKHQVDALGIKSKKLEKTLEDEVKKIKSSVEEGVVKTVDRAEELLHVGINGIKRKFATHTGIDDDVKVKESPKTNKPKTVSEYYGNKTGSEISSVIDVPDGSGRQYKQQVIPTSSIKFGVRNRGEYKDIKTDGLEVTTFHPFTKDKLPDNKTVIAVDSSGNLNVGQYKDFKNNKDYVWSPTTMNYVTGIATDKSGNIIYKKSEKNPAYVSPVINVINDPNGKKQGSFNVLVNKNKNGDYYGSVQGGRLLVKNPDTNETILISGSMNHVKSEFERIKGNSKYLEVYNVDNGTYSRGLSYKDKKLTPERLKKYDEENLDGGGNGLYIIDYKQPVSKFKEDYIEGMPNVRTEKDESYKKGHPLRNEIKNVVLHHTAYTGPNAEKEVTAQYMVPGQNTSHIVIQKNGKRSVYASPEQVTFHAGQSKWNNRDNVNDFSIGVEFQGDTNKAPLTQAQIESFVEYYRPIAKKYNLSLKDVITHQMIAPGRKPDIAEKEYKRILKYMRENNLK